MTKWLLPWTDVKRELSIADAGLVWFATVGTLVRSADGSRYEPGAPVVLSGELEFPRGGGLGPIPPLAEVAGCLRKGATIAGNAEAAAIARRNVRAQLAALVT